MKYQQHSYQKSKYATPTGGANLVMLEGGTDKEKEASAEFIEWMTQTDKIVQFSSSTGYLPTTEDATNSEKLQTLYKENLNIRLQLTNYNMLLHFQC